MEQLLNNVLSNFDFCFKLTNSCDGLQLGLQNGYLKTRPQSPFELRRRRSERGLRGVGGGYLCIDDFQDRKYPEAVTTEMRRSVFRMGNFSFKLRNFSQRSKSVHLLFASCLRQKPAKRFILWMTTSRHLKGKQIPRPGKRSFHGSCFTTHIENDQCGICAMVKNGIGLELTWKSSVTNQRTSNWRLLL